jgi:hypothetical protein
MGDFILAGWNEHKAFVSESCGNPSLRVLRLGVPAGDST